MVVMRLWSGQTRVEFGCANICSDTIDTCPKVLNHAGLAGCCTFTNMILSGRQDIRALWYRVYKSVRCWKHGQARCSASATGYY